MSDKTFSRSVEDYLKAIYGLSTSGDAIATSAIAEALEVQPASVTGMVKRLAERELLEHVPYKGVRLTEAGSKEALRVVRRHRVLETYLHERLGYAWDDVHDEAERLEHAASDHLIERMARALGSPSHDPHGAPIPTRGGDIETRIYGTLADALPGDRLTIRSVRDESAADLRSMAEEGLVPGASLVVRPSGSRGKAIHVAVGPGRSETRIVPSELARHVYVEADEGS